MSKPLLEAVGLASERDDRLLFDNLSFAVHAGTLTRVEGLNGSGKTTLLRILCGLAPALDGEVLWRGEPIAHTRETFQRDLLYIGHRPGVKTLLTPIENARSYLQPRRAVNDDAIMEALAQVGLEGFEDVPCHSLSAGQQRRVALARLYLSDERLWILDEAFTALDRRGVQALEKLLLRRAEAGGAVVLTTHHDIVLPGLQRVILGEVVSDSQGDAA